MSRPGQLLARKREASRISKNKGMAKISPHLPFRDEGAHLLFPALIQNVIRWQKRNHGFRGLRAREQLLSSMIMAAAACAIVRVASIKPQSYRITSPTRPSIAASKSD
jgi:hypothetical protein